MKEKYKIFNPGGNKTALVDGINYTVEEKKKINDEILSKNPKVEQVGFLDKKSKRLEMAGGEFCVNATRCAIFECLEGKQGSIDIKVSGCNGKIKGGIEEEEIVYANMKINKKVDSIIEVNENFDIIKLDGISLIVMSEENSKTYINKLEKNADETKKELKEIMSNLNIDEKALGVILLEKNEYNLKIYPIIWVKAINTLYYETACGSGSLAAAIYKNNKEGINKIDILQPSGYSINVELKLKNNIIESAIIKGIVEEV